MRCFNLEDAKAGKPVCTVSGRNVRIVCSDRRDKTNPIVALVDIGDGETVETYAEDGRYLQAHETTFDLMMRDDEDE